MFVLVLAGLLLQVDLTRYADLVLPQDVEHQHRVVGDEGSPRLRDDHRMGYIVFIEGAGDGRWALVAKRSAAGREAEGRAIVRTAVTPEAGPVTHAGLAAALAWQALGTELLAAGQAADAARAADSGIQELGTEYGTPEIIDDTVLKYFAAQERLAGGHEADAASNLLRVLDSRLHQYETAHAAELD